jgi:thiamine-monophosphate kinase
MQTGLRSIGEFGLIDRIKRGGRGRGRNVLLGIGDDAAAFRLSPGGVGLATTDCLVEGTHFHLGYTSYRDLGWKAMAANLSDIAAMGGRPLLALVSLTLTGSQRTKDIDRLYSGMRLLAERFRVAIVGGDVVRGRELSVTLTVIGQGKKENLGLRSGARPGDAVLVTGTLGASRAGLELLQNFKSEIRNPKLIRKHLRPEPRVKEGLVLERRFRLHGMIDISDGLASELHHLAKQSGVGLIIDQGALPVADEAWAAAKLLGRDPLEFCLQSGEEYELLFTLPTPQAKKAKILLRKLGTPCTVIGQAISGRGVWMTGGDGRMRALLPHGYRHF